MHSFQTVDGYKRPLRMRKPSGFRSIAAWRREVVEYIAYYEAVIAGGVRPAVRVAPNAENTWGYVSPAVTAKDIEFAHSELADQKHFLHLIDTGCVTL